MKGPLRSCLQSLQKLSYSCYRIVVVDNDSGDGSEQMLLDEFLAIEFIQSGVNHGYTGGNNRGIERALSQEADYVLVLNPDTEVVNANFVTQMVSYCEANHKVGIAGPQVFLRTQDEVQNTILFAPGLARNTVNWIRYRINPKSLEFSGDQVVEAEVLNGVCLLLRAECLRQIGLFDENIFMYIEDAEMDWRARQKGWQIKYLPIDSVIHLQKTDGYQMTGLVSFLLKRNSVYYLCKIGKRLDAYAYALLSVLLLLARGLLAFNFKTLNTYLSFTRKLVNAYLVILRGEELNKDFGPPFENV